MNGLYKKRGPKEALAANLYIDSGGDHRDTVFIAGSGRSGTTWLADIVNHDNHRRFIFEPFHPEKVDICENFHRKQYLRPEDEREEYLDAARNILSGDLKNRWADRFNRKVFARRRIVKDIRTNLLIGWMLHNFPGMPIIFLLRHPCAVTDSRLRLGWRDNLDEVMSQKSLVEDFLTPFEKEIRSAKNPFERSIFLWCIENYVPLRQPGIHVVFYERLLTSPETELASLFAFLGETPPRKAMDRLEKRRLDGWRERISESRLKRAVEILGLFGLDGVYGESSMPRPEGVFEISECHH